jgi:hypothetical protein
MKFGVGGILCKLLDELYLTCVGPVNFVLCMEVSASSFSLLKNLRVVNAIFVRGIQNGFQITANKMKSAYSFRPTYAVAK